MEKVFKGDEFDVTIEHLREVFADREVDQSFVGVPSWSTDDEAVATPTPREDGLGATIHGLSVGATTIRIAGRATSEEGERDVRLTLEVQVDERGQLTADLTAGERRPIAD